MMKHIQTSAMIRSYFEHFFKYATPMDLSEEGSDPVLGRSLSDNRMGWFWFLSENGYLFFDIKTTSVIYHPKIKKTFDVELINGLNCLEFPYPVYEVEFISDANSQTLACEVGPDYKGPYFLSDVTIIPYPKKNWNDFLDY